MYYSNISDLSKGLIEWQANPEIKAILLFACDHNQPNKEALVELLGCNKKPLMGGIFPEIIAEGERKKEGFLLIPMYEEWEVLGIENTQSTFEIATLINKWTENIDYEIKSVFCFVNTLWSQKTTLINTLYDSFGPYVHYLGGGAGSLSFKSFPCVFANQQVIEQGAVIGFMSKPITLGVAHGWRPISEAIKVTETNGNSIISLSWQPAFTLYRSLVESHSHQKFDNQNFFEIAKSYPLGLVRLDNEMIIRDPYHAENGVLHIVDEVPEGEYVRIMHGSMNSLLEGAKKAVENAQLITSEETTQFCIDCISRVLFMENQFAEELKYLNENQKAQGILSIGEIANLINSPLELYNKTIVIAQWKTKN